MHDATSRVRRGQLALVAVLLLVACVSSQQAAAPRRTDAAHTDAARTDAAHTDAADTDAAHTDTAHTDAAHTDAAHTDAAHTDAAHTDAAHTDAAHTDAARNSANARRAQQAASSPPASEPTLSAEAVRALLQAEMRVEQDDVPAAILLLKEAVSFDGASAYLRVRLARAYLSIGEVQAARAACAQALTIDSDDVFALTTLAAAEALVGESRSARAHLTRARQLNKNDGTISAQLVELLVADGDLDGAEAAAAAWTANEPGAVEPDVLLARLFFQAGDLTRAARHLADANARDPSNADVLRAQLQLQWATGSYDAAARTADALSKVQGDSPRMRMDLLSALVLARNDRDADALAQSWLAQDASDEARSVVAAGYERAGAIDRAIAALHATPSLKRPTVTAALLWLVKRDAKAAAALACVSAMTSPTKREKARQHDDDDDDDVAIALAGLCARARALDSPARAGAPMLAALFKDNPSQVLLEQLVAQLALDPKTADAVDVAALCGAYPRLQQGEVDAVVTCARGHENLGDAVAARALLTDALTRRPTDSALLFAYARFLQRQGDISGAVDIAERLIERGGFDQDVLNFVAFALADNGKRADDAVRYAYRALADDALNGFVLDTLGWALLAAGRDASSLEVLVRADRLSPNEGEILFHLASAQAQRHDARAEATAKRALVLLPDADPVRVRVQALLRQLKP